MKDLLVLLAHLLTTTAKLPVAGGAKTVVADGLLMKQQRATRPRRAVAARSQGGAPSWLTFLGHPRDGLWRVDLFRCESILYTLRSHPFVERLIGTTSREFLDHTLFRNAVDLERKPDTFNDYYNRSRTHASPGGNTPAEISGERVAQPARLETCAWERHCGGLFRLPVAV